MRREYWGCEMESPLYRQIAEEFKTKRLQDEKRVGLDGLSKRGKRPKR